MNKRNYHIELWVEDKEITDFELLYVFADGVEYAGFSEVHKEPIPLETLMACLDYTKSQFPGGYVIREGIVQAPAEKDPNKRGFVTKV